MDTPTSLPATCSREEHWALKRWMQAGYGRSVSMMAIGTLSMMAIGTLEMPGAIGCALADRQH